MVSSRFRERQRIPSGATMNLTTLIITYRSNKLARNAGWILAGQMFCLLVQAAYFLIITRGLGTEQYGAFVAASAFAQIVSPFVGFGTDNLLVKHVARERGLFSVYYGNLLFLTVTSGMLGVALVWAIAVVVLPATIGSRVIVVIGFAELICSRLVDCGAMAFQAFERLDVTAQLKSWAALARLLGIAALTVYVRHPDAEQWSVVYLLATASTSLLGLIWVHVRLGSPRLALGRLREEFLEGLYFSASLSAQSIYNDIDKSMLARFSTLNSAGIYAAAYRFVEVAFIPVRALLNAAYPGFFRAGEHGIKGALSYMSKLLPKAAIYSCFSGAMLFVCAPIIPHVFGSQYRHAGEALEWLALLPFLKTLHYFLADTLTCSGHQGVRTLIQLLVAAFNVLINLWIIPAYSWRGAAWSSLASDALLGASMYVGALVVNLRPIRNKTDLIAQSVSE